MSASSSTKQKHRWRLAGQTQGYDLSWRPGFDPRWPGTLPGREFHWLDLLARTDDRRRALRCGRVSVTRIACRAMSSSGGPTGTRLLFGLAEEMLEPTSEYLLPETLDRDRSPLFDLTDQAQIIEPTGQTLALARGLELPEGDETTLHVAPASKRWHGTAVRAAMIASAGACSALALAWALTSPDRSATEQVEFARVAHSPAPVDLAAGALETAVAARQADVPAVVPRAAGSKSKKGGNPGDVAVRSLAPVPSRSMPALAKRRGKKNLDGAAGQSAAETKRAQSLAKEVSPRDARRAGQRLAPAKASGKSKAVAASRKRARGVRKSAASASRSGASVGGLGVRQW